MIIDNTKRLKIIKQKDVKECRECGETDIKYIKGLCRKCYSYEYRLKSGIIKNNPHDSYNYPIKCSKCESLIFNRAIKGMCRSCYNKLRIYQKKLKNNTLYSICKSCNTKNIFILKNDMCESCYKKFISQEKEEIERKNKEAKLCKLCKTDKDLYKENICKECYDNHKELEISLFYSGFLLGNYSKKG